MPNPLSHESIKTVKATIPFLMENGVTLTDHFYKRLFKSNPEVQAFFNPSNQRSGSQQKALGGAICAFAQNIETPENLEEAIRQIANKHVSLGIQPEHYPIVGEHLLGSINDLLNPAPQEILDAWAEAYGFLAETMISVEAELYKDQKEAKGGWNGFKDFDVARIEKESEEIISIYLNPSDGASVPNFKAGQYITVRVPDGTGSTTMRNYSLSGDISAMHYRISVKKETSNDLNAQKGYVSSLLHESLNVGSKISVAPPCGDFYLKSCENKSIVLIAGGIGITPLLPMLHSVTNCEVTFIHSVRNSLHHPFKTEVERLAEEKGLTLHFKYSTPTDQDRADQSFHSEGRITQSFLESIIRPEAEIYFCGPKAMMVEVYQSLSAMNHAKDKINFEFFGPQQELKS